MRYWLRTNRLLMVFCLVVLLIIGVLMFTGPGGENVRYQNGPTTTTTCETSGPDVMICTSSTSVVRTPTVQPR